MQDKNKNIRLGTFVLLGTIALISALYLMGSRQNLFGGTFRVSARFYNVNGLMKGNNVRYAGIDVGTVESINILNDTAVNVVMVIEEEIRPFIRQNSIASIGTDGLMGNKLVNINSMNPSGPPISENGVLQTLKPIETDEMVRTLNVTNDNIKVISSNLRSITDKVNAPNSIWSVLMDTVVANNMKASIVNIKAMSGQALYITGDLKSLVSGFKNGKGIGALISDTSMAPRLNRSLLTLQQVSDTAAVITGDISRIVQGLKEGKGSIGILLNDTTLAVNLNASAVNIGKGADNFNENMEALKYSWPFKKYFKKQKAKK